MIHVHRISTLTTTRGPTCSRRGPPRTTQSILGCGLFCGLDGFLNGGNACLRALLGGGRDFDLSLLEELLRFLHQRPNRYFAALRSIGRFFRLDAERFDLGCELLDFCQKGGGIEFLFLVERGPPSSSCGSRL